MLGQLHKKPSVPRLMSASAVSKKRAVNNLNDNDHMYSSPKPKPIPSSRAPAAPKNDQTYAENSNAATEPYSSDNEGKLDTISTDITAGGRLIVASTDKLEISVEYSNSAALSEGTISTTENASEMLLDASNAGIVWPNCNASNEPVLPDEPTDNEALLEATNISGTR